MQKRSFARSVALAALLLAALVAPFAGLANQAGAQSLVPANWIKGFVMIGYGPDPYKITNTPESLARLKATGANSVALAPIWFMNSPTAVDMGPQPNQGTPSDESTIFAIREAHRQGLRVMLRPYIDVSDGSWRADITPSDVNAWFSNYQGFLDHFLAIANSENVEEFTIGVELINMTDPKYEARWRQLISHVRSIYKGTITYSANWGKHTRNEYKQITWWDQLDYIGLSGYFPLSVKKYPTQDELVKGWTSFTDLYGQTYNWVQEVKDTADQYKKPVVFTEIGFGSYSNSPGHWLGETTEPPATNQLSMETQERAVAATLQVWSQQSFFRGIYWWHWEPYAFGGGPTDNTDALNNKPAEKTITNWYGGSGQPAPPPTAGPPTAGPPAATPTPQPPVEPPVQPTPPGTARPAPSFGTAGLNNPAFAAVASPGPDTANKVFFAQTGHTLEAAFLAYWRANGGLAQYGFPISEPYLELNPTDGKAYIVQYFERQRFEYHPEAPAAYRVLLGLLGVQLVQGRTGGGFNKIAESATPAGGRFFAPTGHSLSGPFRAYWESHGGLSQFGYPLSEPFQEKSATNGNTYLVQYFERARFEYHPENTDPAFQVLLGFLGRDYSGSK